MRQEDIWERYRVSKSVELRNEIAERYLPLVKIVCGRLAVSLPAHVDKDDLLSSGFFGLLDAIERYDIRREIKFETYAGVRIRGAMLDYLRAKDWLPVGVRQKLRLYEKTAAELENRFGRRATDDELAKELNVDKDEIRHMVNLSNSAAFLPLEEYLKTEEGARDWSGDLDLQATLGRAVSILPERERLVVTLYYYEEMTLKEISLVMKLTEARISQMHKKALMTMREFLKREAAAE